MLTLFTYPNRYYTDKWGRRWPMIIGGVGMGISMLTIGVVMKTGGESSSRFDDAVSRLLTCETPKKPRV